MYFYVSRNYKNDPKVFGKSDRKCSICRYGNKLKRPCNTGNMILENSYPLNYTILRAKD